MNRVGFGFDTHRFSGDLQRPLVLGGVHIAGVRGLDGHSDADVVAHAVIDALLGAAGLGDIGQHFPDTDPKWSQANSLQLLHHVYTLLKNNGWRVENVDCTVVAEQPKIAPYRAEMEKYLGKTIEAPLNVKASRAEGMGAIGRVEGIACWAVALIVKDAQ